MRGHFLGVKEKPRIHPAYNTGKKKKRACEQGAVWSLIEVTDPIHNYNMGAGIATLLNK